MPDSANTSPRVTAQIVDARLLANRIVDEAIRYQSFGPVSDLLPGANRFLRPAIIEAILSGADKLGPVTLSQGLKHIDKFVRQTAASTLASINSQDAMQEAIDALSAEITVGNVHFCAESIQALGRLRSKEASSALISKLELNNVHIRLLTTEALAYYKNPDAIIPLISLLRDRDYNVRKAVIVTLGRIGDQRAAAHIMAAAYDNSVYPIHTVVEALGNIGDASAVGFVCSALSTNSEIARIVAAEALGKLGDDRAVESLCKALRDRSNRVRRKAVASLGKIQSRDSIPPLRARLTLLGRETDSEIRSEITKLLAIIDPPALRTEKLPRTIEHESPKPESRPRSRNADTKPDGRPRNIEEPEHGRDS